MSTSEWKATNADKMRKYRRDWYAKNQERGKKSVSCRRQQIREWIADLKLGKKCSHCPETHPACLDYHHRDPAEKEINVSQIAGRKGWGQKRVLEEVAKCDLLCANCHRKLHWSERQASGD